MCACGGGGWRNLKHIYCPKTKLREGNVFTPVCQSFCLGGAGACHDVTVTCYGQHHPTEQTPPPTMMAPHPRMDTPSMAPISGRHPSGRTPPWSTSGRYPSYWNAFLFKSELCSPLIVDFTLPKSEKHKIARIIFFSSTLHFTRFTFTKYRESTK